MRCYVKIIDKAWINYPPVLADLSFSAFLLEASGVWG